MSSKLELDFKFDALFRAAEEKARKERMEQVAKEYEELADSVEASINQQIPAKVKTRMKQEAKAFAQNLGF